VASEPGGVGKDSKIGMSLSGCKELSCFLIRIERVMLSEKSKKEDYAWQGRNSLRMLLIAGYGN
jgi:hypothetical protein